MAPKADWRLTATEEVEALLAEPARALVEAYFDPAGPFAASTFDTVGTNARTTIGSDDLLAITFLDVAIKPHAVRSILYEDRSLLSKLLRAIPADVDLWDAADAHLEAAEALWTHLRSYKGVDRVIAGKLLARKRPRLIPVVDKWTVKALPTASGRVWSTLAVVLADESLRDRIEELRPATAADPTQTTTLRLLDAAMWMRYSRSRNARKVRG